MKVCRIFNIFLTICIKFLTGDVTKLCCASVTSVTIGVVKAMVFKGVNECHMESTVRNYL